MSKRVQPSTIDLLPMEAEPDVRWAAAELLEGRRYKTDILAEFNERLAAKGLGPISSTAFHRHSVWLRETTAEIAEMRDLGKAVVERLGPDVADDAMIMLIEMCKTSARRILHRDRDTMAAKDLKDIAQALNAAIAAQSKSAEARRVSLEEMRRRADAAADAVTEKIVAADPTAKAEEIRRHVREDLYGIYE